MREKVHNLVISRIIIFHFDNLWNEIKCFFFFSKRVLITYPDNKIWKKKMVKNIIDQFDTFEKFILRATIFVSRRRCYIKNYSEEEK